MLSNSKISHFCSISQRVLNNFVEGIDSRVENFIKHLNVFSENQSSFDLKEEIKNVVHEIILFVSLCILICS
jgi:hypothetical protein